MLKNLVCLLLLINCVTLNEPVVEQKEIPPSSPPMVDACKTENIICSESEESPTLCFASEYDHKYYIKYFTFNGWGRNECLARLALIKRVCEQNIDPQKLQDLECIPDPSNSECPPSEYDCSKDTNIELTECFSRVYHEQNLPKESALKGWGFGECRAKSALLALACQLHLQPSKLSKIRCKKSNTESECPLPITECDTVINSHECRISQIKGNKLRKPLIARGMNRCEAELELKVMACNLGIKPSYLDGMNCSAL